ncbi:TPA: bifunctional adenosylcobinamide kinase/adenosylcobinamide-phosphate guanylyltransferase, partial [Acinetobacter baumannii]
MLQLILGGARSGKSRLAEQTAISMQLAVTYVATAQALDPEMQSRIAHHQNQRPAHWSLVEEPLFLAKTLQKIDRPNQIILVDCLTLWLTNLLLLEDQNIQQFECEQLLKILPTLESEVILVSNET